MTENGDVADVTQRPQNRGIMGIFSLLSLFDLSFSTRKSTTGSPPGTSTSAGKSLFLSQPTKPFFPSSYSAIVRNNRRVWLRLADISRTSNGTF